MIDIENVKRLSVTDLEFVQGPEFWEGLSDPFPAVELQGDEDEVGA